MSDDDYDEQYAEYLDAIERCVRAWMTPERTEMRLAWLKMSIALQPEIKLGSYPRDER